MLRMIDRHAVQQMLTAGVRIGEVTRYFEVSRRTIERIRKEPAVEGAQWPAGSEGSGGHLCRPRSGSGCERSSRRTRRRRRWRCCAGSGRRDTGCTGRSGRGYPRSC